MAMVAQLGVFAVRSLFEGFCKSIGFEAGGPAADAAVKFLGSRFVDHSARLETALSRSTGNAWRALELSLAGDTWWDRVKQTLARKEDNVFREQVAAFLRTAPLDGLPGHTPQFRRLALADLRAAHKAGILASGGVDPQALAKEAGAFARHADPVAMLDAEYVLLGGLVAHLRTGGYTYLADFLALKPHDGLPMLVVAVRYFFRREMEDDQALSNAMSFAKLEQMAAAQENGYDALMGAISRNGAKLDGLMDQALAVLDEIDRTVKETHGDVKDIKAALAAQGQALDLVGQVALRSLLAGATPADAPTRSETDIRQEMLNALLTTPHRDLMPLWPLHQELCAKDPRFYVRLAAWYHEKGDIRDHKEMFVVTLALSSFEGHRDVGLALLRKLPPHQVARVVDFVHGRKDTRRKNVPDPAAKAQAERDAKKAKKKGTKPPKTPKKRLVTREVVGDFGLFRAVPRSMKTEVARYLAEREAKPEWFDSTVLTARKSLKRLYAVLHVKPGERAQRILFDDDPPPDSRLATLKRIVTLKDPEEQAKLITSARIPFRVALGVVSELNPAVLRALVDRMTPTEVINNLNMLRRHGALADAELKLLVDLKLEQARNEKKVSALKTDVAAKAVEGLDDETKARLDDIADERLKAKGRLTRPTALLVDKSGSMETAIDVGLRIAAMVATVAEKGLFVYAFDSMAYELTATTNDWAGWKKAFAGIHAQGETSVGVCLELMRRRSQRVEQIVIVTDEEEYNPPYFVDSLLKYRQALGVDPTICFVKVPDSTKRLEDQCRRAGIAYSVFEFKGDYYSLPDLVTLLEPPSQLDLLLDIMAWPLPERKA